MISLIAARSRNNVIGDGNAIPWRLKHDFKHFKAYTLHKVVVMGRKTWDSLPMKPLPDRINVVLSRNAVPWSFWPAHAFKNLDDALKAFLGAPEIVIIGGAEIYRLALEEGIVDRIIMSEIDEEIEGDTKFPDFSLEDFRETRRERIRNDTLPFDIVRYERNR